MKAFIIIGIVCLLTCHNLLAQPVPQYPIVPSTAITAGSPNNAPLSYGQGRRLQLLYKPSEFPGASAGNITHVFLRSACNKTTNTSYRNLTIKMAYMPPVEGGGKNDTFKYSTPPYSFYPTQTVFYSPMHTIYAPLDSLDWIPFTLQTPFYFDGLRNFIVEFSQDSGTAPTAAIPVLIRTMQFGTLHRNYEAAPTPIFTSNWGNVIGYVTTNVIGFNIQPVINPNAIRESRLLSNLSLYPNPSDGRFTIRFDVPQQVRNIQVTITNVTGSIVFQEDYHHIKGAFSRPYDLSQLPRSVYFATIKADGEKVSRKVVLQ